MDVYEAQVRDEYPNAWAQEERPPVAQDQQLSSTDSHWVIYSDNGPAKIKLGQGTTKVAAWGHALDDLKKRERGEQNGQEQRKI